MIPAVEVVTHTEPTALQVVGILALGALGCALSIAVLMVIHEAADAFWNRIAARATEAAKAGKRTETWAAAWGGSHEDVARVERELAAGEYRAKLTTPKPVKSGRLAAVKRGAKS